MRALCAGPRRRSPTRSRPAPRSLRRARRGSTASCRRPRRRCCALQQRPGRARRAQPPDPDDRHPRAGAALHRPGADRLQLRDAALPQRRAASSRSGSPGVRWQRFIVFDAAQGPEQRGRPVAAAPANGGGDDVRNFLHINPYPNTAAPGPARECEAGNEPWVDRPAGDRQPARQPGHGHRRPARQRRRQRGHGGGAVRPFSRRASRRDPYGPAPDPRIWGRKYRGPAPWIFGCVMVVILAIGSYLAFTKELPFTSEGYRSRRRSRTPTTLRTTNSPVRIAGVNVGKVTDVERDGDLAEVTFTVDEEGQPIHDDAEVEIRPRLFLEGNFFLDLHPGSPSAPELADGGDIPITQTATAVQLDEVLTALQAPTRARPAAAARGLRDGAHLRADGRRGRRPGSRRPGRDRRPRRSTTRSATAADAGRGTGDRQQGAARRRAARPLRLDPRPGEHLRQARGPRAQTSRT